MAPGWPWMQKLNSNWSRTDPRRTPFTSLRSLPSRRPLAPSTKPWPVTSSTKNCTTCPSSSTRRSPTANPRRHTVSHAAVRSTRTAPAVSLFSKQSAVSPRQSGTNDGADTSMDHRAARWDAQQRDGPAAPWAAPGP